MYDEPQNNAPRVTHKNQIAYYWALAMHHLWTMLAIIILVVAVGAYFTSQQPKIYQATASVTIETSQANVLENVDPIWDYMYMQEYYQTQQLLMASTVIAERVVDALDLRNDLEFLGVSDLEEEEQREILAEINPVELVRMMYVIVPREKTHIVDIVATGTNPELIQAIVNGVAEAYEAENFEQQLEATDNALSWLNEQLENYSSNLDENEQALFRFLADRGLLSVSSNDEGNLTAKLLFSLSSQLDQARLESDRLQSIVHQIETMREEDLVDASMFAVIDNPLIQSFKTQLSSLEIERVAVGARYLNEHPDYVAIEEEILLAQNALDREIENVLQSYEYQYETARLLVRRIESRLDGVRREAISQRGDELQYNRMLRETESDREMFDMIEQRLKEVELSRMLQTNNVEVIERANLPISPIRPNPLMNIVGSFVVGIALALALVFLLEQLDHSVKSQETLEIDFALTYLGMIPTIKVRTSKRKSKRGPTKKETFNPDLFVADYPKSSVAEACRSIRTNLLFLSTEQELRKILVTSAGPKDGKTITAISIGTVMAQSGSKVLLIDTDMRRPRLHKAFGVEAPIGISSVLLGDSTVDEAIQKTEIPNVDLLPCGPIPANPSELMLTERFSSLIKELSERYDRVIFDTPPVAPVTDAALLSSMVDGVILVVRAGETKKDLLRKSVDHLDNVRANIVGVVLNNVDPKNRRTGYYYNYYYQRYGEYYGTDEEASEIS